MYQQNCTNYNAENGDKYVDGSPPGQKCYLMPATHPFQSK